MTRYKGKPYSSAFSNCNKRSCFVPFNGNGQAICRLYELGQCKGNEDDLVKRKGTLNVGN